MDCMSAYDLLTLSLKHDWMMGFVSNTFVEFVSHRGQSFYFELRTLSGLDMWCWMGTQPNA